MGLLWHKGHPRCTPPLPGTCDNPWSSVWLPPWQDQAQLLGRVGSLLGFRPYAPASAPLPPRERRGFHTDISDKNPRSPDPPARVADLHCSNSLTFHNPPLSAVDTSSIAGWGSREGQGNPQPLPSGCLLALTEHQIHRQDRPWVLPRWQSEAT